jgi:hypothetical protein
MYNKISHNRKILSPSELENDDGTHGKPPAMYETRDYGVKGANIDSLSQA